MMRTGKILWGCVVDGAVRAMAMVIAMERVKRTRRAVIKEPGEGRSRRMGSGNGRRLRMGRTRDRQRRMGRGWGMEWGTGKGKVLINKHQGEKARRAVGRLQGARAIRHGGQTGAGIFRAGSIT